MNAKRTRRIAMLSVAVPNRSREACRGIVAANRAAGREDYAGLTSAEIGDLNRAIMFGENDEAFPSQAEWSSVVD